MIHAAEQDRPDVAGRRDRWRVEQLGLEPAKLVFIDETWAKTTMTCLRGRAPRGQRLIEKVPHGHWKTTTLLAALDDQGMRCATTVDGAVNGNVFTAFVDQVIVPTLKPGDIVIMDNLSAHKVSGVRDAFEAVKAEVIYLPPYSPALNPIELAFSKLKTVDAISKAPLGRQTLGRHPTHARRHHSHRRQELLPPLWISLRN